MTPLTAAIDRLYRAFAVPKPRHIEGCPCCVDRKGVGTLLGKNLRDITPGELTGYAASAFLTVGSTADYLYFLPRILDVTATEPGWWPTPEVTGRAIRSADVGAWSGRQRGAVAEYFAASVAAAVADEDAEPIDDWLCGIGRAGFDVRPHLDRVAACPAVVLGYFEMNAETLPRNRLSNAFWERRCPAHDAIVDWFYSPPIAKIPFDAYGCVLTRGDSLA